MFFLFLHIYKKNRIQDIQRKTLWILNKIKVAAVCVQKDAAKYKTIN